MSVKITADHLESLFGERRLMEQLAFVLEVEKLKTVLRRTSLLDRSRVENDAEHTWQLALMAVVLAEHADEPIDLVRVLKMILIHDVVEIDAGDTFAFDASAVVDQAERERRAADRIFGLLPADQASEFRALWDEFEAKATSDARFAAAMDRLQPALHNFFTDGGTWRAHGVTAGAVERRLAPIGQASTNLGRLTAKVISRGIDQGFIAAPKPQDTDAE
ncbi:Hydrolase (HAD superfamily) [Labilithrix luteola]|uniref:Hydrolase (HAD superfamily) n=1 Tax=Labilithrix luteola TaxID=1391654 RepID=A0A0K1Q0U7_9BACT|nr:HD domain-containing protein [Labilithrix luteola]AKU99408.1 Hydrolase (HAD superfamily) [Labilithrix luteola]